MRGFKTIILLVFVVLQSYIGYTLGKQDATNASISSIIGGTNAVNGQFPWSIRVYFTNDRGLSAECMGSLYQLDWVLTAGHCVQPGGSNYRVKAGTVDFFGSGAERVVSRTIRHPAYNSDTSENDIGLLQLSSPFEASSNIRPIPVSLVAPQDGEVFVTAGFGYVTNFGQRPATLQWVRLPYINPTTCERTLRSGKYVPATMVCAGGTSNPPADTCNGDSGSALVRTSNPSNPTDAEVVGLTSFGTTVCASGSPAVYTRVAAFYSSFIVPNAGPNPTVTTPATPPVVTPPTPKPLPAKRCKRPKNKKKPCKFSATRVGVCRNRKCRAK